MPRPTKEWQPLPSQRHCSDIRRAEAKAAEAERRAQIMEEEKQSALWHRSSEKAEVMRLEVEANEAKGPSLVGSYSLALKVTPRFDMAMNPRRHATHTEAAAACAGSVRMNGGGPQQP